MRFGHEGVNGGLIIFAGGDPGNRDLFAGELDGGFLEVKDDPTTTTTTAINGIEVVGVLIGVDAITELVPEGIGKLTESVGGGFDGIRECAGEIGKFVDLGIPVAEDLSDSALAVVLGVDVGFEFILVGLHVGLVEVLNPAFGFVHGGALFGAGHEGVGVEGDLGLKVHALGVGVLFVAGVHGDPAVAFGLPPLEFGAAIGGVANVSFDPDSFDTDGADTA